MFTDILDQEKSVSGIGKGREENLFKEVGGQFGDQDDYFCIIMKMVFP